jgi:hypothetical protein
MDFFSTSQGYTSTGIVWSLTSFADYFLWYMFHKYVPVPTRVIEGVFVIFSTDSCDITPQHLVKYILYREDHIGSGVG